MHSRQFSFDFLVAALITNIWPARWSNDPERHAIVRNLHRAACTCYPLNLERLADQGAESDRFHVSDNSVRQLSCQSGLNWELQD